MTSPEYYQAEIDRLAAKASAFEVLYLRLKEANQGSNVGIARLSRKCRRLESDLHLERADKNMRLGRLFSEVASLNNKVQRLSLKLMDSWSREEKPLPEKEI